MSKARNGSTRAWRKARAEALASTGGRCVDCGGLATEVDHVRGIVNDPTHLVLDPLCHRHHVERTTARSRGQHPRSKVGRPMTVVAGRRRIRLGPTD